MQGGVFARTVLGLLVVVGAVLFGVVGADVPVAGAQTLPAAARPAFASPFPCGQVWFARTYPGHPLFAIDWNLPGSGEADYGQHVLAGAAGVVTVATNAGYGLMVTIDHGNGWSTLYAHFSAVAVSTGQRVTPTTLIGAVGHSGRADGSHLHQEQQFNGVRQPILVDNHTVDATYSSRGASYASANCVAAATHRWSPPSWRVHVTESAPAARPIERPKVAMRPSGPRARPIL
jgi:murein DD-endopeptidase MepM/ murein hydrolase activator NlpD